MSIVRSIASTLKVRQSRRSTIESPKQLISKVWSLKGWLQVRSPAGLTVQRRLGVRHLESFKVSKSERHEVREFESSKAWNVRRFGILGSSKSRTRRGFDSLIAHRVSSSKV